MYATISIQKKIVSTLRRAKQCEKPHNGVVIHIIRSLFGNLGHKIAACVCSSPFVFLSFAKLNVKEKSLVYLRSHIPLWRGPPPPLSSFHKKNLFFCSLATVRFIETKRRHTETENWYEMPTRKIHAHMTISNKAIHPQKHRYDFDSEWQCWAPFFERGKD